MKILGLTRWVLAGLLAFRAFGDNAAAATPEPGLVRAEFIYERAPFPECHASTIVEADGRLLAAWFGGTEEKHKDVEIWTSHYADGKWSPPVSVANGIDGDKRYPTWNPVLFQPKGGPLALFYKVGPTPSDWWGMRIDSTDGGKTWSKPVRLPDRILGPIKNKPVQLANGDIVSGSSTEHDNWRVHFERSTDNGKTWSFIGPVNDGKRFGAIQPAILVHKDGRLQALCRSEQDRVVQVWSEDNGKTWGPMSATSLPNPNSGLDAVTLADGRHLIVYNHTPKGRSPLSVAVSSDGKTWKHAVTLEKLPGEYSYPAVIQGADGKVHITYTWKRERIKYALVDPTAFKLSDLPVAR